MKVVKFFSILLLSTAFVFQMITIIPSGSRYCFNNQCGIHFWGAHEHDAVWHLGVAETLFNHVPFQMPNMSGTLMHGYNFLLDIVVASLSFVTTINTSFLFFKILPVIWFGCMSYFSYVFAKTYRDSKTFPVILWFFVFFGSSFSYILKFINTGSLWGASSILSMQSLQNMLNPQFAWSLIPLLLLLIGINKSQREYLDYVKYGVYIFIAIGLKFYTGAAMLLILGAYILISVVSDPKKIGNQMSRGLIVLAITTLSVIIFYAPGGNTGFPFIFKPLATVNPIIEDKSLFYLSKWAERLYSYQGIKLAILEFGVLSLFLIFNYGTRILGLIGYCVQDNLSKKDTRKLLVIGSTATMLLSILFTQRGVWWNTVQFLYVSLFLAGILAAEGIDKLITTKKVSAYILSLVLILLTIPTNLDVVHTFARFPGTAYIADDEIQGLQKLRSMPAGVILTPLFAPRAQIGSVPELSHTYDTAYISAYTGKQTYLSDLIQLELTNVDYTNRQAKLARFDCQILEEVKYLYEYKNLPYANQFSNCGRRQDMIFEDKTITVYQIN